MHNSISSASVKALDLSKNHIPSTNESKTKELGNYTLNVTDNFKTNAKVSNEIKTEVDSISSKSNDNKRQVHTVSETTTIIADSSALDPGNEFKEIELKLALESDNKGKSVKRSQNAQKVDENTLLNDDEPLAFTEESLKVFESSGLTKEENKIIEALDDTISGYVNAAFSETNDPLDGDSVDNPLILDESRPDSRSSSTSNQSGSDKPGIIVTRRESDVRRLKRPNSVSFQLPENHVDKQTKGQYNTLSGNARGYKRVLASQFYSYRPNSYSAWSTSDFPRHSEENERVQNHVVPRKTESFSKKSIGPFNASFSEWLRKKPKGSVKLKPVQNGAAKIDTDVKINLPTHTKKRATILDTDTSQLISKLETNVGVRHLQMDYKLKDQPYIVQQIGGSPNDKNEKGDKFLY